jgi:hypothetical protein
MADDDADADDADEDGTRCDRVTQLLRDFAATPFCTAPAIGFVALVRDGGAYRLAYGHTTPSFGFGAVSIRGNRRIVCMSRKDSDSVCVGEYPGL